MTTPSYDPQPSSYHHPSPTEPVPAVPAAPSAPPSPYGQAPTDPYAQPTAPYGGPPGGGGYATPGVAKRGMKGWKVALLATGTGVAGLLAGIAIGGAGEEPPPAAVPAHTQDSTAEEDAASADEAPTSSDDSAPAADAPTAADTDPVADSDADTSGRDEEGSRANPFAIGTSVSDGEWDVVLSEPSEAWAQVQEENQFNDPPPEGMEYYLVPVSATYIGAETGLPWIDLTVEFVGSDARTYSDRCGVIPDDLSDVDELYEGGTGEGNVCVTVPQGADGLWTLSTGWGDNTVFFDAGQ